MPEMTERLVWLSTWFVKKREVLEQQFKTDYSNAVTDAIGVYLI